MHTQREIAEKLNISQTAVSLVLNDPNTTKVSAENRSRILDCLTESRYRKREARVLNRIFFIGNSHLEYQKQCFLNGVSEFCERYGIRVEIRSPGYFLISRSRKRLDGSGAVLCGKFTSDEICRLNGLMPVCHLNPLPASYLCDCICGDSVESMQIAIQYLLSLGHKKIALWGMPNLISPENQGYYRRKVGAFRRFSSELLEGPVQDNVFECLEEDYAKALGRAIDFLYGNSMFTAVVSTGYAHARILYDAAICCRQDIKIVSCGYEEYLDPSSPRIDYVACSLQEMGTLAASQLFKRAEDPDLPFVRLFAQPKLTQWEKS